MKRVICANKWYFGKDEFEQYGDKVAEQCSGKKISKRIDLANEPGGLIYEAALLDMDMWDLLSTLEGMCYNGTARAIDDSTYQVIENRRTNISSADDVAYEYYSEDEPIWSVAFDICDPSGKASREDIAALLDLFAQDNNLDICSLVEIHEKR